MTSKKGLFWSFGAPLGVIIFMSVFSLSAYAFTTPTFSWEFEQDLNSSVGSNEWQLKVGTNRFSTDSREGNYSINFTLQQTYETEILALPTSNYSVSVWVNLSASQSVVHDRRTAGAGTSGPLWYHNTATTAVLLGSGINTLDLTTIDGGWYHVVFTLVDGGNTTVYINGDKFDSTADVFNFGTFNTRIVMGAFFDGGTTPRNKGNIDAFRVWTDYVLTPSEVQELFALGGGSVPQPAQNQSVQVVVRSNFTNALVNNFTMTIFNSTNTSVVPVLAGFGEFSLANGSYQVNVTSIDGGTRFDINGSSFDIKINETFILNLSAKQSVVNVSAREVFTGTPVTAFNITSVSFGGQGNTLNGLVQYHADIGLQPMTANSSGYFTPSFNTNVAPLSFQNITLNLSSGRLNVSIQEFPINRTIENYTLIVTDILTGNNVTTVVTGGGAQNIEILTGRTYQIDATDLNFDVTPRNFTLTDVYSNVTIFAQAANTINLNVFSESINKAFGTTPEANETVTFEIIGPTVKNISSDNGTLFVTDLLSGEYEIRYEAASFDKRSYFFELPPNGSNRIDLFLLNKTLSTLVAVRVIDQSEDPLNGTIVNVLRFYASENAFKTVEMAKTNFNGETPIHIELDTEDYKFFVVRDGDIIFTSTTETKIIDTSLTIQINLLGTQGLDFIKSLNNVATSLTGTKSGNNLTFTYNFIDISGFAQQACLQVDKIGSKSHINLCNTCSTSSSGSLICQINETQGNIVARGIITTNNPHTFVTDTKSTVVSSAQAIFGDFGLFVALTLYIGIIFAGLWNPIVMVLFGAIGLVVSIATGMFAFGVGIVLTWVIGGLAIALRGRK